jgi:hypothetical protein
MHRDELLALMKVPPGDYARKSYFSGARFYGGYSGVVPKVEVAYELSWISDTEYVYVGLGPDDRVMRTRCWPALPNRSLSSRFTDWLNSAIP